MSVGARAPMDASVDAYLLCTAPRSGSTMLCRMLRDTGAAGDPRSYFHRPSVAQWRADIGLPPGPAASGPALFQAMRDAIAASAGDAPLGVRLQRHSAPFFFAELARAYPDLPDDRARLQAVFGRVAFVHLRRADSLRQAISYVKAQQTGLWHRRADGTELERSAPPAEPVYDPAAIAAARARFEADDADWRAWFDGQGIAPVTVIYEDLVAAPTRAVADILSALGQPKSAARGVRPSVARLSDGLSAAWARRFLDESARGAQVADGPGGAD